MNPTRDTLTERYSSFETDRLLSMLSNQNEYTTEAIDVLRAELARRKVSDYEIQQYVAALGTQHAEASRKAAIPLSFWEKFFFFFVWFSPGFISVALGINYLEDGYDTKLHQSRFFRLCGFASLFLIGFLSVMRGFGEIIGITFLMFLFGISYWAETVIYKRTVRI